MEYSVVIHKEEEGGYWVDDGSLDLETLAARLGVQVRPTPEELGEETTAPA